MWGRPFKNFGFLSQYMFFLYFSSMSETATVKKIFVALFISLISKTHSPWTLHWWIGVDQLTGRGPVGVRENILSIRLSIIIHCVWGRGREGIETWGKSNCGSTSDQSRNHSWDLQIETLPPDTPWDSSLGTSFGSLLGLLQGIATYSNERTSHCSLSKPYKAFKGS